MNQKFVKIKIRLGSKLLTRELKRTLANSINPLRFCLVGEFCRVTVVFVNGRLHDLPLNNKKKKKKKKKKQQQTKGYNCYCYYYY